MVLREDHEGYTRCLIRHKLSIWRNSAVHCFSGTYSLKYILWNRISDSYRVNTMLFIINVLSGENEGKFIMNITNKVDQIGEHSTSPPHLILMPFRISFGFGFLRWWSIVRFGYCGVIGRFRAARSSEIGPHGERGDCSSPNCED